MTLQRCAMVQGLLAIVKHCDSVAKHMSIRMRRLWLQACRVQHIATCLDHHEDRNESSGL
jgi:hypothetical protein